MRKKPLALVACAVLAATAFTACGDDDDDDAPIDTGGGDVTLTTDAPSDGPTDTMGSGTEDTTATS